MHVQDTKRGIEEKVMLFVIVKLHIFMRASIFFMDFYS